MGGVATLAEDRDDSSGTKKRRQRRARREETAVTAAVVAVAIVPEPAPAANQAVLVPAPEVEPDDFKDLLGQAVGLRLDSVSREFGGNDEMHVSALRNVSLEIGPCEFVSVVGPSGCGKTTLLSLMGGLDRPTSGHVYGAGLPLGELSDHDLADYRLQRVSTIFQTFNLIPDLDVFDNIDVPLRYRRLPAGERRTRIERSLELVGQIGRAHV